MDYTGLISYVEENNFNGAINMKMYSDSCIYKWSKEMNEYLTAFKYSWRVKPNCKDKVIEIVR